MIKLLDLKPWLSVCETAKHLSCYFNEDVTEADVLRLGLDGQLRISAYFVNGAYAIKTNRIPINMAKTAPSLDGTHTVVLGIPIAPGEILEFDEQVTKLAQDVFDLPMVRGEIHSLRQRYQDLIGGPDVELLDMHGVFVENAGGTLFQIQDLFCRYPDLPPTPEPINLFDPSNFFPAARLPKDSMFVVRTSELRRFEDFVSKLQVGTSKAIRKSDETKSRDTLLCLIAAAVDKAGFEISERGLAKRIATWTEVFDCEISEGTIKSYLDKIPDALERRKKAAKA